MRMRYIVLLGAASLFLSATAIQAEDAPKLKVPEVKIDAKAQKDAASLTNAVKKDAENKIKEAKEKSAEMQKEQMKKADEMKKEAAKGSEKGQAMREEHSKKWGKFLSETNPVAPVK